MSRFRQGWELTKKSWALLRSHRELFRFPIYGALAAIVIVAVTVGPGFYLIDDGQRVVGGLLVAIGLYLALVHRGLLRRRPGGDRGRDLPRPRRDRSPTASRSPASGSARSPAGRRSRRSSGR